ncbi:hypothetical protein [Chitinophaga sp. 212800010-3]|uniref:hypothetical protein n=1 Tax=unclassified Chitinophaga TaxID=2619133 RepID=UPI002DE9D5A6|nr:Helix-turn-helix domain-containing protein [Chitinophaga sp. 212800010-3]
MDNNSEIKYIQTCLALAEVRLNRGPGSEWTSYDFEKVSDAIAEATGVTLSVTTLKRLWGKVKYNNIPATTTLNALAQFAGYTDWRTFKLQQTPLSAVAATTIQAPVFHEPAPESQGTVPALLKRSSWKYWLLALIPLLGIFYLVLLSNGKPGIPLNIAAFQFSSNKIKTNGVPNSVIFNYDAAAAGSNDSVFISQSWDVSRKMPVSRDEKTYSSIYYEPGYFRAKLIINKQIVKEHDLMISSGGWLAMVLNKNTSPVYFKSDEVLKDSFVDVSEALLSHYNIPLLPAPPALRIYNVQDLGDFKNDDFTFETTLKSGFHQGAAACQHVSVLLLCKNDVFMVPLCAKGCVGDITMWVAGTYVNSKKSDLSRFGCDLDQWVTLRIEAHNRHVRFLVNGVTACEVNTTHPPTDIVGLQYRFEGTGAVKDTWLRKGDRLVTF